MIWHKVNEWIRSAAEPTPPKPLLHSAEREYEAAAKKALQVLQAAERYFNAISDPELVEYAAYEIEAARRKYEYMLRKLRSGEAAWENEPRLIHE